MHKGISCGTLVVMVLVGGYSARRAAANDGKARAATKSNAAANVPKRLPWTTSRITGTPDPPHPYKLERAFPKLTFKNPLLLTRMPGAGRFVAGENAGKLYSFANDEAVSQADLFLDLTTEIHSWDPGGKVRGVGAVYGLAFHPQFASNRFCYVCYVLDSKTGEALTDGTRVSRFRVTDTNPPRCDPKSEQVVITWLAGGHNGGDLHFGPDGFLYISTGDGAAPNPPDNLNTGQDLSDLLSSILRIDVDHPASGKAYAIPPDNPFIHTPAARPEIWAYGLRNPWRMSFDRGSGDLWVGDVGWELWEMVYRIRRGGNYGWSVMEGRQPVRPESKRGPTPILPSTLDFPHTEAASITGGYVYRGKRFKELAGVYLCGDWMTRKIWGTRLDGDRVVWHRELAQGSGRIVAFGEDDDGELYIVFYDEAGSIQRLVPNPATKQSRPRFPTKLSETGLFTSVKYHRLAPGVVPFSINAGQWLDHATAERFIGLPGTSSITAHDRPVPVPGTYFFNTKLFFPKDSILARTLSMEMERGNPRTRQPLETQVLHFDGGDWRGYSYRWDDAGSDAELVPAAGSDRPLQIIDREAPGGKREQTWHFPGRAECLQCHNGWAGYALAFTSAQLARQQDCGGNRSNQLAALEQVGLINFAKPASGPTQSSSILVDPYNRRADIDRRARAYLHVNCSHCHQPGAGGTADIDLRYDTPVEQMKIVGVRPMQGTFAIYAAHIVSPGDPFRSALFYRMSKLGPGRMPHIGSEIVDNPGLRLIHDWIEQLRRPGQTHVRFDSNELLSELLFKGSMHGSSKVNPRLLDRLLASTDGALRLAYALGTCQVPEAARRSISQVTRSHKDPQVRDLFERFLPPSERIKRLGTAVRPEQILALKGDAGRGRDLFFSSGALECVKCHRVAGQGCSVGPDLTTIGKKYSRAQILESILEPSKSVEPAYVTYLVETKDGQVYTGLLAQKTTAFVLLKTVGDKEIRIEANQLQTLVPQRNSLMPELLLRDLTVQQAADLVDFLAGRK